MIKTIIALVSLLS